MVSQAALKLAQVGLALATTILPAGFEQEVVADGLRVPVSFAQLPDGRTVVAEHAGRVRVVRDGRLLRRPLLDLRARVNNEGERGLMAIAARGNFVYLLYAHDDEPMSMRLSRFGARSGSEEVLLDGIPADCRCHVGGSIRFDADGNLFVSTGDAATAGAFDARALRAQDLDSLAGKVLRVGPDGEGLPGNPFWTGDPSDNRSKVWAYGLRNPFRFSLRPADGVPVVGDVGWRGWEEVNVAAAGANLGWPCFEGRAPVAAYAAHPACRAAREPRPPLYAYGHHGKAASITAGVFLNRRFVFADFVQGWIRTRSADGELETLAEGADGPVELQRGPAGELLYLSAGAGELRRIRAGTGAIVEPLADTRLLLLSVKGRRGSYSWDFGDGTFAASASPRVPHLYAFSGTYVVRVTSGRTTQSVRVVVQP